MLTFYTTTEIREILGLPPASQNDTKSTAQYTPTGPGETDRHAMFSGAEAPFLAYSAVKQSPKPSIIFSNSRILDLAPTKQELAFISALIREYDVYCYDENQPLSHLTPIRSSADFWTQQKTITPAPAGDVQNKLRDNQFVVIDYAAYEAILARLQKKEVPPNYLDLRLFDLSPSSKDLTLLRKNIASETIESIDVTAPTKEELIYLRQLFPNLKKINVRIINSQWIDECLDICEGLTLKTQDSLLDESTKFSKPLPKGQIEREDLICTNLNQYQNNPANSLINSLKLNVVKSLDGIEEFSQLRKLEIQNLFFLEKIPFENLRQLKMLYLRLPKITNVTHFNCYSFSLDGIEHLVELENLHLSNLETESIPFENFTNLQQLTLNRIWITSDNGFNNLNCCTQLTDLEIIESNISHLSISKLTQLKHLKLSWLYNLSSFNGIENCTALESLEIEKCDQLAHIPFEKLKSLKHLKLSRLDKITSLDGIENCSALESLEIEACDQLAHIPFEKLKSLKHLKLSSLHKITSLEGIEHCTALESLEINLCSPLANIPFAQLKQLKHLVLSNLNITSIEGIEHCSTLESLQLHDCAGLDNLAFKETSPLKRLELSSLLYLTSLDSLNRLAKLNSLTLDTISSSADDEVDLNLSDLAELREVHVSGIHSKINQYRFSNCRTLQKITFKDVVRVKEIHAENAPNLRLGEILGKTNPQTKISIPKHAILNNPNDMPNTPDMLNTPDAQRKRNKSRYNPAKTHSIDKNTSSSEKKYTASGELFLEILPDSLDLSNFRVGIFDEIQFEKEKIIFQSTTENLTTPWRALPRDLPETIPEQKNQIKITFTGMPFKAGELYALPSFTPDKISQFKIQSIDDGITIGAYKLFYSPTYKQYAIRFSNDTHACLSYSMPENTCYENELTECTPDARITPLLPQAILERLAIEIPKIPELRDLQNKSSLEEITQGLIAYCKNFKDENLSLNPDLHYDDLDTIIEIIRQQKGVCRHRAEALMLLTRFFGLSVRMVTNEDHAFCEMCDSTGVWHRMDTGGGTRNDQTTAKDVEVPNEKTLRAENSSQKTTKVISPLEPHYQLLFSKRCSPEKIHHLSEIVSSNNKKILLTLSSQKPLEVYAALLKENGFKKKPFLYIHNAAQFQEFFEMYKMNRDGARYWETENTPLKNFIRQGFGRLIVNWANFTPTQIGSYQSIYDTPPTLHGILFSPDIQVIGFRDNHTEASESFFSRVQECELMPDTIKPIPSTIIENSQQIISASSAAPLSLDEPEISEITIDLFQLDNWSALLTGEYLFSANVIKFIPSSLLQLIHENKPFSLTILNPPQGIGKESLDLLLFRLQHENKFYYNGEFLSANCQSVQVKKLPIIPIDLKQITVQKNVKLVPSHAVEVTLNTWYQLFTLTQFDRGEDTLGLLHAEGSLSFYINDVIDEYRWQHLLTYIKTKLPDKSINFYFAKGAGISGVYQDFYHTEKFVSTEGVTSGAQSSAVAQLSLESEEPVIVSTPSPIILTNDPDFYVKNALAQSPENTLVIDVTPDMTMSDLIEKITPVNDKASGKFSFHRQESAFLKYLRNANSQVIINGELSPTLLSQLHPLLFGNKKWVVNGQMEILPAKLSIVMPLQAIKNSGNYAYQTKEYAIDDYISQLDPLSLTDSHYWSFLDLLRQFFIAAEKLPHSGKGRPESLKITNARFMKMLSALSEKKSFQHNENPLKGFLLYDYPKESEDYAYLNVAAKYCFKEKLPSENVTGFQAKKLQKIIKKYGITPENAERYIWRLLNCCNANLLQELLGQNFLQNLQDKKGFPKLKPETLHLILETLFQRSPALSSAQLSQSIKPVAQGLQKYSIPATIKTKKRLTNWLGDSTQPFIFIKGEAGIGKTHFAKELKRIEPRTSIYGTSKLKKWLTSLNEAQDAPAILWLDEGNMAASASWDFLKPLTRGEKIIYFDGVAYPIHPQAKPKIAVTGNPESYPNRYYHALLQDHAETIFFQLPGDEELTEKFIKPRLESLPLSQENRTFVVNSLLAIFHYHREHHRWASTSLRDLNNLISRFLVNYSQCHASTTLSDILYRTAKHEFYVGLHKQEERDAFDNFLKTQLLLTNSSVFDDAKITPINQEIAIAGYNRILVDAIKSDLALRERSLTDKSFSYKPGILIEGDVGLGKSTLIKAILESQGFVPAGTLSATSSDKTYYEITAGSPNAVKLLRKAHEQGAVVILDELNLDEDLEQELIRLFEIVDKDSTEDEECGEKKRRFMVFASQNSGKLKGRKNLSDALQNRFHFMKMENYTKEDLVDLIAFYKIPEPEIFADSFLKEKQKSGSHVTQRQFFECLRMVRGLLREAAENILIKAQPITNYSANQNCIWKNTETHSVVQHQTQGSLVKNVC